MLGDLFDRDRLESPRADVKSDGAHVDADFGDIVKQLFGEVKACGWSSDGSRFARVDGLIVVAILGNHSSRTNIRRYRNPADAIKEGE